MKTDTCLQLSAMTLFASLNWKSNAAIHWAEPTARSSPFLGSSCSWHAKDRLSTLPFGDNPSHLPVPQMCDLLGGTGNRFSARCLQLILHHVMTKQGWAEEADWATDFYPVLTSTGRSFYTLLFILQEPVAIGTWQVDLIVCIGMQTPLGFSHAGEEPVKGFTGHLRSWQCWQEAQSVSLSHCT